MTAYRFVTLTCDRCYQIFDGGTDRTASEARSRAKAEAGWIQHRRGGDLCGVCAGTHERIPGFEDQVRPVHQSTAPCPACSGVLVHMLDCPNREGRDHCSTVPSSDA